MSLIDWVLRNGNSGEVEPHQMTVDSTALPYTPGQSFSSDNTVLLPEMETEPNAIAEFNLNARMHCEAMLSLVSLYEVICREFRDQFPVTVLNSTFERIVNAVTFLHEAGHINSHEVAEVFNRVNRAQLLGSETEPEPNAKPEPAVVRRIPGRLRKLKL